MYICCIFSRCLNTLIRRRYFRRTLPHKKPVLCPFYSVTYLYVENAEDANTLTPFLCYIRNTVGIGKCLQSDLRFRIRRWRLRMVLALQTFLYLIPRSLLSHSSRIIPSFRSCSRPLALSQLNSWPKVSFFALSSVRSFLAHPLSFTIGQILYLLSLLLFASGLN
jgi:hypothetical protein